MSILTSYRLYARTLNPDHKIDTIDFIWNGEVFISTYVAGGFAFHFKQFVKNLVVNLL